MLYYCVVPLDKSLPMKSTSLIKTGLIFVAGLTLSTAATAQNDHAVTVGAGGFVFEPQDLNLNIGDKVTWVWSGGGSHNVRAVSGAFLSGNPTTAPNTYTVTFDTAFLAANPVAGDLYDYRCDPHGGFGMVGSIRVMSPRVLSLVNFSAGQLGTMNVDGMNAGGTVLIGYSLTGNGPFGVNLGTLSLSAPINQLPALTADAAGHAELSVNLPPGLAGTTVHLHAGELFGGGAGILTNPVTVVL
ncbi:MAG: hypothetical protein COA70_06200 [Planctomycetota bacterium]|nr:MAG: hypothetical protein COA70_06200 [Planctomycetota bacterium]